LAGKYRRRTVPKESCLGNGAPELPDMGVFCAVSRAEAACNTLVSLHGCYPRSKTRSPNNDV